jgi:M6 family metalloprotease-like protein
MKKIINLLLGLSLLLLVIGNLNSAWLEDIPGKFAQPDGKSFEAFLSGDEFYHWVHDEHGFTIIQDEITGYWCWAVESMTIRGDIESSGYPVHLYGTDKLGLKAGINISKEKYLELREPFDIEFDSRYVWSPSTGTVNQIVIFIRFSCQSNFPNQAPTYNNSFNALGGVNSKRQYFRNVSYWDGSGHGLDVVSHFFPPFSGNSILSYQSPHPRGYFMPFNAVSNPLGFVGGVSGTERRIREHALLRDAILDLQSQIEANLSANQLDADGNGRLDNVVFMFRGDDVQNGGILWPHRWSLSTFDVRVHNIRVWDYNVITEQYFSQPTHGGIGLLAHEFAHSLGLPDLYRYSAPHEFRPIGMWDLMSHQTNPPQSISAYMKWKYTDWIDDIPWISVSNSYTLNPLSTSRTSNAYRVASPNSTDEYFVVEYRRNIGIDSTLPGSGLLVYRAIPSINTGNRNGPPDELYVYRPNGTTIAEGSIVNAFFSQNSGRTAINSTTNPTPFLSNGSPGGLNITEVGNIGNTISFNVTAPTIFPFDLEAQTISGPSVTIANQPANFTVRVSNRGLTTVSNYTVSLRTGNDILATVQGVSITPGSTHDFTFSWTPTTVTTVPLRGFVSFPDDQNIENNLTNSTLHVNVCSPYETVYANYGNVAVDNIRFFQDIVSALYACQPGGRVMIAPGLYTGYKNILWPQNKNITVQGSKNPANPTEFNEVMCCTDPVFVFHNVGDQNKLEHIKFLGVRTPIELTNSNPVLDNLTFHAISAPFSINSPNLHLQITNCKFYGSNNSFSVRVGKLELIDCEFIGDISTTYEFDVDRLLFKGNTVNLGAHIKMLNTHTAATNSYLHVSNNRFENNGASTRSLWIDNVGKFRNVLIDNNIFFSPEMNGGLLRIDEIGGQTNNQIIRYINNTYISNHASGIAINVPNTFHIDIRNSLFRGNLSISQNQNIKISHSWFNSINNLQGYTQDAQRKNVHFGDPQIHPVTFQPIWTTTTKSPLIDWGHRDTNANGVPWYNDPDDQDADGTRLDIGAVPAMGHGAIVHTIFEYPGAEHPPTKMKNQQYAWVCFPYIDGLYNGGMVVGAHTYDVKDLIYNLHYYNDNHLLFDGADIKWLFNTNFQSEFNNDDLASKTQHLLDSRYGYKIRWVLPPNAEPVGDKIIETAGFIKSGNHNSGSSITINAKNIHEQYREIWVGYFRPTSQPPLEALSDISDHLIEIKTKNWSMNRATVNDPWLVDSSNPLLNFGEAVSLKYVGSIDRSFVWRSGSTPPIEKFTPARAQHFEFIERADYIPIHVALDENMIGEYGGEIAIFIDGECYGAEVILGNNVQINAYIIPDGDDDDLDIDFENAIVEFEIKSYGTRSAPQRVSNYMVMNQNTRSYHSGKINLAQNMMFYKVSFVAEENSYDTVSHITRLEGNYPNPFNPSTTISFSLAQTESVNLSIFNVRGQLIKTLVNDTFEAGRYSAVWDGEDSAKNRVSSGIYFYRLETGSGVETKKMLLMK